MPTRLLNRSFYTPYVKRSFNILIIQNIVVSLHRSQLKFAVMKFIAYYRVSTKKQGLGLEAQQAIVQSYLNNTPTASLIAEYSEKESGKEDDRQQLHLALEHCKREDAVLLLAKLDRLSRKVSFIFALREANIRFKALDLPEVNDVLTLAIYAGLAEKERTLISERTKAALKALKEKGVKLGKNNLTPEGAAKGRAKGRETNRTKASNNRNNITSQARAKELKGNGYSIYRIAQLLNDEGYRTSRGCLHTPCSIQRLLKA